LNYRLLLTRIKGATSFESIKEVNGIQYASFQEAALRSGLIEHNEEWIECLREASLIKSGRQMRELYVLIIVNGHATNYRELWENFKEHFVDDFVYRSNQLDFNHILRCEQEALIEIDKILSVFGKSLTDYTKLPQIISHTLNQTPRLILEEKIYTVDLQQLNSDIASLNVEQSVLFNTVINDIKSNNKRVYFVDGPGGTGKSFLFNTILAQVRSLSKIAIAVASSSELLKFFVLNSLNDLSQHFSFQFSLMFYFVAYQIKLGFRPC
jgi:hypothetical protein